MENAEIIGKLNKILPMILFLDFGIKKKQQKYEN